MHHTSLISTIVIGLVLAFIFGAIANRLRISPLVGYLLAGVAAGLRAPDTVDVATARFAEHIAAVAPTASVALWLRVADKHYRRGREGNAEGSRRDGGGGANAENDCVAECAATAKAKRTYMPDE